MSPEQYRPSGFKLLPDVVKNLLIINGIFFLATVVLERQGINLSDMLGLHYFSSGKFRPFQLITYMFMHANLAHIFFNMFALWMFGSAVENIWGGKKFLFYYIFCGLGAAVAHYAVVYFTLQPGLNFINDYIAHPSLDKLQAFRDSDIFKSFSSQDIVEHYNEFTAKFNPMINKDFAGAMQLSVDYMQNFRTDFLNAPVVVGASGAVFGLLLAYGMMFPNSLLYVYFAIPIKAKYFVIIYGLIELFSGVANVSGDNVAHFAHLGGLFFGFLLIMFWRYQRWRKNKFFR
jgi:membrane associated rhomboid family serine protease